MAAELKMKPQLRGDTFKGRRFQYLINGVAQDLSNYKIRVEFRKQKKTGELQLAIEQGDGITIEDQVANLGWFRIDKFLCELPVGNIYFDIQLTDPYDDVETPIWAVWEITQDITQKKVV